jgi:hypothetical protein
LLQTSRGGAKESIAVKEPRPGSKICAVDRSVIAVLRGADYNAASQEGKSEEGGEGNPDFHCRSLPSEPCGGNRKPGSIASDASRTLRKVKKRKAKFLLLMAASR